jgi:PAS domain S-box-containing protein
MAFEQNRFSASKQARDTDHAQITGPITLVQDKKKTPGFLQFVPFYNSSDISTLELRRKHFVGHVYAPFIMNKLIKGTLQQNNRHLIFSIYDENQPLYDELVPENSSFTSDPLFRKKITLQIYGRTWDFDIQTAGSFSNEIDTYQSSYILVGGLVIDFMLISLFFLLSNTNRKSLSIAEKITKKLEVSEEYFRHIIESAPCGIIIISNKGVIEKINPQVELLFGYKTDELLGKSIEMLVPDDIRHKHAGLRAGFHEGEAKRRMGIDRKVFGLRRNGEKFPAEVGLANFNSPDGRKVLSTIIDMTEYVAVSDELRRSNKDLNDFAYVASHDLKAPLRGIMQLSNWIEEDVSEIATDETKKHLGLLQNRTARLEKLLDDLLTYARIDSHLGDINTVDVKELVEEVFSLLNPPPEFILKIEGELPVFDTLTTPLDIIFRNLIGNAIKHHDKPNGIINISFTEDSNNYQFTVSNDGPGIKHEHQAQIFEMFKTLKPRDEVEGSGMGLALIKKILQYQGGSIEVFSDTERGVSFVFSWPKVLIKGLE